MVSIVDALRNIPRRIRKLLRRRPREDYFTPLPDVCLLEIFKHLTRKDIDHLKTANKKIHSVSNDKSLDRIKWEKGGIYVFQSERGYGFELRIRKDEKKNKFTSYQYDIYKSDNGTKIEERKLRFLKDFKYPFKMTIFETHFSLIPDTFFAVLSTFLRLHEAMHVELIQVPFDPHFFSKLKLLLHGHSVGLLTCRKMKCDGMITDELRQSFIHFTNGIKFIDIQEMDIVLPLVNEKFLSDLSDSKVLGFKSDVWPPQSYPHRFQVQEPFLPRLLRFHSLKAFGMILNANWLINLIMEYLDEKETFLKRVETATALQCTEFLPGWEFALDQPITTEIITQQLRYNFEHIFEHDIHQILNKTNDMKATFSVTDWPVGDENSTMIVVDINFQIPLT